MKAAAFDYARPTALGDALERLLACEGVAQCMSGSQSLGPMLNLRLVQPDLLVDLRAITALRACRVEEGAVVLGALTTHAAIEDRAVPDATRGLMPWVARGIAYRAIRNRGTLGGSLAHADPAADWVNLMAVLDAECIVAGPSGGRSVPAAAWVRGAFTTALQEHDILTAVRIPQLSAQARWSFYKVNRKPGEFAQAIAAFVDDPERGVRRAVIGALAGPPYVIDDAAPLIDGWDVDFANAKLAAAGLEVGSYDHQIHVVALARAARALGQDPGDSR
ncbi:MAG TPA: FAD binding domain-containing protein [Thiomonas arsenitoxydans]|uniref:FAD binding domain-containing protein n=1 Tax=Thiomonas arsenitoxydans (strain DSM 22701 / CIP 110005 / 3As) TaxID=426114 RepID=UPI002C91718C|nr:FAD binding domain-containing protein [Thiomonas arsenitoxydans]HML83460.1 FAD binding domain-containing protein [Thiomonas arsenitoxydans]